MVAELYLISNNAAERCRTESHITMMTTIDTNRSAEDRVRHHCVQCHPKPDYYIQSLL